MTAASTRPIRVLHVLHSLDTGGAERIVCDLARDRRDALTTGVICLDYRGRMADGARRLGIEVFCTDRRAGLDLRQVGRIARLIDRFGADVIHAHQYTPYFYAALAAAVRGFGRILFTEHGRHWPDVVSTRRKCVNQLLRLRRDRITAVCEFAAEALRTRERIAGRDVRIIPNGVRCDRFDRPRRRGRLTELIGADADALICIQVGRFSPVKDHATSLQAFALARQEHRSAHLVLVGDGDQREQIEQLCGDLGLTGFVHLLGPRDDVPDLLAAADVFVLSSLSEAASLSILEAMSAGLSVVATDVGGNPQIVRHGRTGLLSGRGDRRALAANLTTLLADGALRRRMGDAGRRRARLLYDQRRMHDAFVAIYRELVGDDT